jgi:PIN domain nuclease of toxin-antitoxin system
VTVQYLIDTCVALWYFEGSSRIPVDVREILRNPVCEIFVSDVSILEVVIKYGLGKLQLPHPPSRMLLPLIRRHAMDILPLTTMAIFRLEQLPSLHRDPFDRLLVAQALEHGMTLVTPDPQVRQYPIANLWV